MNAVTRCAAILAAVAVAAWGQSRLSLMEDLTAVYTGRCRSEVETLAAFLNERNKAVVDKMPASRTASVHEAATVASKSAEPAIHTFQQLLESPHKFNGWAAEDGLPSWFKVPDSVIEVSRWEGLRPFLAPVAPGERLGWGLPDNEKWQSQPAGWRLEFLLILKWLEPEAASIRNLAGKQAVEWAEAQARVELVNKWREMPGQTYQVLHGQYRYTMLPALPGSGLLRPLKAVQSHVAWSGRGALSEFLPEKEALLEDLLADLEGAAGASQRNAAAALWFDAIARSFPPLSAFQPVPAAKGGLRAMLARNGPIAPMLAYLRPVSTPDPLSSSVLWHQSVMTPEGRLNLPVAAWSSLVPEGAAPLVPERRVPVSNTQTSSPQGVWHDVCAWAVQVLARRVGSHPIRAEIENPLGWTFAFRADELKEVAGRLGIPLVFAGPADAKSVPVRLSISNVNPHSSIGVRLWSGGELVEAKEFAIPGPWPPWLAADRRLPMRSPWTLAALVALALLVWRIRRIAEDAGITRYRRFSVAAAGVFGISMFAVALLVGPRPAESPELGGSIEFTLPLHGAAPDGMQLVIRKVCLAIYSRLCEMSEDERRPSLAMNWPERWKYSLGRMFGAKANPALAVQKDALAELYYRLLPAAFPQRGPQAAGRVHISEIPEFRQRLENLRYEGEPDLPDSLLVGPEPGFRLSINLIDGDHGGVMRPADRDSGRNRGPVLTVELPTPTRDDRSPHGLLIHQRLAWIRAHSGASVAVMGGFPDSLPRALAPPPLAADVYASEPHDLEAVRTQWWSRATTDAAMVDAVAVQVASRAAEMIRRPNGFLPAGSHTGLRLQHHSLSWFIMLCAIFSLALAYHLSTDGASVPFYRVLAFLVCETVFTPLVFLAALMPVLAATFSRRAWTYGDGLLDVVASVRSWLIVFLVVAVGVRIVLVILKELFDKGPRTQPQYRFSLMRLFATGLGSVAGSLAISLWISAPVREAHMGAWLPSGYAVSAMAGLTLWLIAVLLFSLLTEISNR